MRDVRSACLRCHPEGSTFRKESCGFPKQKGASFLTEEAVDAAILKAAIDATGYSCLAVTAVPFEKKGLF